MKKVWTLLGKDRSFLCAIWKLLYKEMCVGTQILPPGQSGLEPWHCHHCGPLLVLSEVWVELCQALLSQLKELLVGDARVMRTRLAPVLSTHLLLVGSSYWYIPRYTPLPFRRTPSCRWIVWVWQHCSITFYAAPPPGPGPVLAKQ